MKIKLQELNPGGNEKSSKKVNHAEGKGNNGLNYTFFASVKWLPEFTLSIFSFIVYLYEIHPLCLFDLSPAKPGQHHFQ